MPSEADDDLRTAYKELLRNEIKRLHERATSAEQVWRVLGASRRQGSIGPSVFPARITCPACQKEASR